MWDDGAFVGVGSFVKKKVNVLHKSLFVSFFLSFWRHLFPMFFFFGRAGFRHSGLGYFIFMLLGFLHGSQRGFLLVP